MKRFIEGESRHQITLMPACLDDYIDTDNPVRVIDLFVDELDLAALGFEGTTAAATGRPGYHPALLLKIYIYGYLNRIQSSRRLERETQRNVELMWLTEQLSPDFKTIADFRHDNGKGIRNVCKRFVALCRQLKLFSQAIVAIDGRKISYYSPSNIFEGEWRCPKSIPTSGFPAKPRPPATVCAGNWLKQRAGPLGTATNLTMH